LNYKSVSQLCNRLGKFIAVCPAAAPNPLQLCCTLARYAQLSSDESTQTSKSHQNCFILFRSYCCVKQTSLITATQPKHVGHGQNSLLTIWKFDAIRWSALFHLPLIAHWNTNVSRLLLKIPKVRQWNCTILCDSWL